MNTQLLRFSTLTVHPPWLARFRTNRSHQMHGADQPNRAANQGLRGYVQCLIAKTPW